MRSDNYLGEAVEWCKERGLEFWAHNENPGQSEWTNSPKVFANIYIDDAAHGCPLICPDGQRPYVDWLCIYQDLANQGVITQKEEKCQ